MKRQIYIKDEVAIRAATADLEQQNAELIAQLRVKQKREDAMARVYKETYDIKANHEARIYQMNKKMAEMDRKITETDKKIAEMDRKAEELKKKEKELQTQQARVRGQRRLLAEEQRQGEMDLKIQEAKTRHHRLLLAEEQAEFDEHEARFQNSAREEWEQIAKQEKALNSFKTYLEAELSQCNCERKRSRLHNYYAKLLSDETPQ